MRSDEACFMMIKLMRLFFLGVCFAGLSGRAKGTAQCEPLTLVQIKKKRNGNGNGNYASDLIRKG